MKEKKQSQVKAKIVETINGVEFKVTIEPSWDLCEDIGRECGVTRGTVMDIIRMWQKYSDSATEQWQKGKEKVEQFEEKTR